MDADVFDSLARSLAAAGPRRRALAVAISGALAPLLGRLDAEEAAAHNALKKCRKLKDKGKRKKCVKKAKQHNAGHICVPSCNGKACGDDGCGGSCGSCTPPETCLSGTCRCVPRCAATKPCGPDGCGKDCGFCNTGTGGSCQDGVCICAQDECNGKCVLSCEATKVRAPAPNCYCCTPNGTGCALGVECCSYISANSSTGGCLSVGGAPYQCYGRTAETGCEFDAQCASGNCRDSGPKVGTCA